MHALADTVAFQRNIVVAASAGTGKTHRLTGLYVLLTLGLTSMGRSTREDSHPPLLPDRIVATTFSRAAALEIRTRIEDALRRIAASTADAPFADEIAARVRELARPPSPGEIAIRAQRALDGLHEARIETLHGLCADLLRTHAFALGLSPSLRVLEEDEAERLAFGVIDEALANALDGDLGEQEAARGLADACGGFFRARGALLPFFDRLDDDGLDVTSLGTSDYLGSALELRARLLTAARSAATSPKPPISSAARALLAAMDAEPAPGERDAALGPRSEEALVELFSQRKPGKMGPGESPVFTLRDELAGAGTNADKGKAFAATLREAGALEAREHAMLALLASIRARLRGERLERGVVGFSDLLRLARDGLRDHADVAEAAQSDIDALLVDEFQDTSLVQRDLVYLLRGRGGRSAAGSMASSPTPPPIEGHGLFIVGDRKQSIYAFRGADVSVFNRVCGELCGIAAARDLDLPEEVCSTNPIADLVALRESYRSLPAIVEFVNAFSTLDFAASGGHDLSAMSYGPAEHLIAVRPSDGERVLYVHDEGEPIEQATSEPLLAGAGPALREAFVAAATARDLVSASGLAPRDIAILARRRASIPLLELGLWRFDLPYVVAGRALFDTLEVRDLAALVRLVLEPRDRHALAHVLRGPLVALSEDALVALATGRGLSNEVLAPGPSLLGSEAFPEESARLDAFRARFAELRPTLLRLPAPDALRTAMEAFDLDRIIAALPRAPARLGNLDRLVHIARERGGSLFSFSRWLNRQIDLEVDESEAVVFSADDDAVRLLTIHGAKGLDFPATIVVDLGAREQPGYDALRFTTMPGEERARFVADHKGARGARIENAARKQANRAAATKAAAERARITYVALTRARKTMCLIGSSKTPVKGSMLATFAAHRDAELAGLVEVASAAEVLSRALARPLGEQVAPVPEAASPVRSLPRAGPGEISIATTPLAVYRGCQRRFWFRFMLGLEEPVDTGQLDLFEVDPEVQERKVVAFEREEDADPRATGRAAHRVLERLPIEQFGALSLRDEDLAAALEKEGIAAAASIQLAKQLGAFARGPYAQALPSAVEVHREAEVVFAVGAASSADPTLSLRGTVDLWARFDDRIDLIDYKLARPSPSLDSHAFQLRAYAAALSKLAPGGRVRSGIVFLGGGIPEPRWLEGRDGSDTLDPVDHAAFEGELAALTASFAKARSEDVWPGVELPVCRRERCGFVTACHRPDPVALKPTRRRRR